MRLLLDTQVVLWSMSEPGRLARRARAALEDADTVIVSTISLWEIAIKQSVGKLRLDRNARSWLAEKGMRELPIIGDHAEALGELPLHHRDPFDRMLVAQARYEGLTFVTADRRLEAYPVALLRADG